MWPWPLTLDLEHLQCVVCDVMKLCSLYRIWTLKTTFFGIHFCRRKYRCIFNYFYVIRPEIYWIRWNYAAVRAITPFKVTDFGTNRKLICDFLLVINSNLYRILHRFPRCSLRKVQNRYIRLSLLRLTPPPPTEGLPWDNVRKIFTERSEMAKIPNGVKHCRKFQSPE